MSIDKEAFHSSGKTTDGAGGRERQVPFLPVCMQTLLMDHSTLPGSEAPPASQSWYHK